MRITRDRVEFIDQRAKLFSAEKGMGEDGEYKISIGRMRIYWSSAEALAFARFVIRTHMMRKPRKHALPAIGDALRGYADELETPPKSARQDFEEFIQELEKADKDRLIDILGRIAREEGR